MFSELSTIDLSRTPAIQPVTHRTPALSGGEARPDVQYQ
jgi:hypothetical protein